MPRKTASDDSRTLSRRVLVTIYKDSTDNLVRVAWQHEIPILELVHDVETGSEGRRGGIEVVDSSQLDDGYSAKIPQAFQIHNKTGETAARPSDSAGLGFVFVGDARAEYARLEQLYGADSKSGVAYVEQAYGRFRDGRFEDHVGGATVEDMPEAQLRSVLSAYVSDAADVTALAQAKGKPALMKLAETVGAELA